VRPEFRPPPVNGPRDVPRLRAYLLRQWEGEGMFAQGAKLGVGTELRVTDTGEVVRTASSGGLDVEALTHGVLWWCDDGPTDLLQATAPSYPDDVALRPDLIPRRYGFCVFAHPLTGLDAQAEGETVYMSALAWAPVRLNPTGAPGVGLCWYVRYSSERALAVVEGERRASREVLAEIAEGSWVDMWAPMGRTDWVFGSTVSERYHDAVGPTISAAQWESMVEDRRIAASLWALAATPTVVADTPLARSRQERRQAERHRVSLPEVRVLSLRPGSTAVVPAGHRHVEWRHRWVVRAHWRSQAYGPGRTLRRPVLIPAHVKGPADAELKVPTETVWRLGDKEAGRAS
jgi:hypothetical protein